MDGPSTFQRAFHLAQGDAVAWLRTLPPESIDLVVTDPPYESLEKHRAIGTTTRLKHSKASSNDWFSIFPNARFPELFEQVFRVLKRNTHFYLYCDPETMFVAKPLAEKAGFKFWKPLIWDKCLAPDTLVWTERGVVRIDEIVVGDRVALPEGGTTQVRATRRTRAPAVRLSLSDGTTLVASHEHRFMLADGTLEEAGRLTAGTRLCTRSVRKRQEAFLELARVIPEDEQVTLGLETKLGERVQCDLQNDTHTRYPRKLALDYDLGRFIGLFAAEGSHTATGVTFACHAHDKHLQNHIARLARSLGARARLVVDGNACSVHVDFEIVRHIVRWFVGGASATTNYLKSSVYSAPEEFRKGLLAGLEEGDGHWSHEEQRFTYVSASRDLAMFVRRELERQQLHATLSVVEDDHAGGWRVRHDPVEPLEPVSVVAIDALGEQDLVDISIADRSELFLLANGVVTHNCSIGMGYHYRARYECVLFFEKGKRKLNHLGIADIIQAKRIMGGYPAEKPPEVSDVLIRQSSERGELVIDPFMGSGSVGLAAVQADRFFAGNDLCAEAVEITRERLRDAGAREVAMETEARLDAQLGLSV